MLLYAQTLKYEVVFKKLACRENAQNIVIAGQKYRVKYLD